MRLNDYEKLVDCYFVSKYDGHVISYWSNEDRERNYNYKEIEVELMKQLTCEFDPKNCVILFPLTSIAGTSMLFNNRDIVIDHCTYILDIARFLKSKGVIWKDGSEFTVDQSFPRTPMLVINNGLAKIVLTANPLQEKKDTENKEIFFSGFLVNRIRNNNF